jgi:hypothetical protein
VAKAQVQHEASVGIAEHGNSAVLVTVAPGGELLDRRRIDLTRGLPTHPYHHEGSWAVGRYVNNSWASPISLADAVALVERVRESAVRGAREGLEALAATVPVPIARIAIRVCPQLPPTTEERIVDTRAANLADSVMYREALATAAVARGWSVASAYFATRRRRLAARISMLSCGRRVDRSGRLGRLNTNLRQLRLLQRERESDQRTEDRYTGRHADGGGTLLALVSAVFHRAGLGRTRLDDAIQRHSELHQRSRKHALRRV